MSHYNQRRDIAGDLDYELYQLPTTGSTSFRGPPINISAPYLAFIGSAQTFGRFVPNPFPSQLGKRLGIPVLNLAMSEAGPRDYLAQNYLELINTAEAVVIQIMPRHDNFGSNNVGVDEVARSVPLEQLWTDYMLSFVELLRKIIVPKILFWFSTHAALDEKNYGKNRHEVFEGSPHLVNQDMVQRLTALSDMYVECVSTRGLPNMPWPSGDPIAGAASRHGTLDNHCASPEMHTAAADALESSCRQFLGRPILMRTGGDGAKPFVIVAAARTGTNLLISMLNDFSGCYVGGELFNFDHIENDIMPWRHVAEADRAELCAGRRSDPIAFWQSLHALSAHQGLQTVGFKLLYGQGEAQRALLEYLAADMSIPIIHLTRRNLLRRLVSVRQAQALNRWAEPANAPVKARPKVRISMGDIVASADLIEKQQAHYDSIFAGHRVLRLIYEDLARRPVHTAERAAGFLGLDSQGNLPIVKWQKTGHEYLSHGVVNYEVLRAQMHRLSSFFED